MTIAVMLRPALSAQMKYGDYNRIFLSNQHVYSIPPGI